MKQEIRIGTRGSKLALWQANYIKLYLEKNFLDISTSIHVIQTRGRSEEHTSELQSQD